MAGIGSITGAGTVVRNMHLRYQKMADGYATGLKRAGLMLQRESQRLVPVNFGVLKNSAFTRAQGKGFSTIVTVGYTASYALYVHEAVGMVLKGQKRTGKRNKGKYWDPQGRAQAKFLEQPARDKAAELRLVIKHASGIKEL